MWSEANSVPDSYETRSTSHALKQVKSDNAIHSRGRLLMADCLNAPRRGAVSPGIGRIVPRTGELRSPWAPPCFRNRYDHH